MLGVIPNGKNNGYIEGHSNVMKDNVIITWAVGHLVSLCSPEKQNPDWGGRWDKAKLPMIPKEYKYEPLSDTADQFKVVKTIYKRPDVSCIYYAGDSGREGIYIQALIRNQIFKTAPKCDEKVVWISSFSEEAILEGVKTAKPYSTYQNMVDSGYARAISDWLIGMNFTQSFTLTANKLINTGRVITPTLAMVVNRQNEIDNFKKTFFYGVQTDTGIVWKAIEKSKYFESDLLYNENGFLKEEDADKLLAECNKDKRLGVTDVRVQKKTEYAPYLFNLADLQAYCSKVLKISPADTLAIAQKLYEGKFTTYPRTDSRFLDTKTQNNLASFGYKIPSRYVDDNKVTDHYAVIPDVNGKGLSSDTKYLSGLDKAVYEAIEKRFLDTMKLPFVYDAVSVTYKHPCQEYFFESFRNVVSLGFKEDSGEKIDMTIRPIPKKGAVINVNEFVIRNLETKPPVPYTTGSLIIAMEKAGKLIEDEELREQIKTCGIGTSATRAAIIDRLADKEFITIDKKQKIAPTEFGKAVISIVEKYDETLVSPIKTAEMETQLDKINKGELNIDAYLEDVNDYVKTLTKKIISSQNTTFANNRNGEQSEDSFTCPNCGGEVVKGKFGWYCRAKCGLSPTKVFGHELTDKQIIGLFNGKETSFTSNGKKTIVLPEVVPNEWQGKTYYNWKTKRG